MGLLRLSRFSSVPKLFDRISQRQKQRDTQATLIPQDRLSFIIDKGDLINVSAVAVASTTVAIHTVNTGKVFFLIVIVFGGDNNNATADVIAWLQINGVRTFPLFIDGDTVDNMSISFSNPIKLTEGQTVSIESNNANLLVRGGIVGYEIDSKLIEERL